ncbi:hypothetical protein ANN_23416 [Periplaneta americana]|uniref:Uncharacterized protein n=1 Tax=Periplaneta americana TaxID=6978 RepID=A0ABQ8SL16_PERAM|nr:hypothetical protein ANN_23416 [Periplaneta americana]
MTDLREGGNEPPGSMKAIFDLVGKLEKDASFLFGKGLRSSVIFGVIESILFQHIVMRFTIFGRYPMTVLVLNKLGYKLVRSALSFKWMKLRSKWLQANVVKKNGRTREQRIFSKSTSGRGDVTRCTCLYKQFRNYESVPYLCLVDQR